MNRASLWHRFADSRRLWGIEQLYASRVLFAPEAIKPDLKSLTRLMDSSGFTASGRSLNCLNRFKIVIVGGVTFAVYG
ncbi:hypothetical protein PO124_00675 [Bacillus licheniformis]|nr:hypothetical protein [Bacillus licheniformis]